MTEYTQQKKIRFKGKTIEGDIHTPIAIFQKLKGDKKFLLESSHSHQDNGRFSYIGTDPYLEVKSKDEHVWVTDHETGKTREEPLNVVEFLKRELLVEVEAEDVELPPFNGGAMGYLGYDVIRLYENIGTVPTDELDMPDAHFLFFKQLIVFDHLLQKIHLLTGEEDFESSIASMKKMIAQPNVHTEEVSTEPLQFSSNFSQTEFEKMIIEAKEAIVAGEIFQIVLSQRFQASFNGKPFDAYRRLRLANPSPYMFYLEFGEYTVLGSSPKVLLVFLRKQYV